MAGTVRIGGIRVDMSLGTAELQKSIQRATKQFSDFSRTVNQVVTFVGVQKALTGLSRAATATFSALDRAGKVEGLQAGFKNLQRTIDNTANDKIANLRKATTGLISDFDLMKQANAAVILGVDNGSGAYEKAAGQVMKLGRAMGIDAMAALESFTTGTARQSKLWLDNLGILIDVEKAHRDYAKQLGVDVKALTEHQKKLAFTAAAFKAVETAASDLSEAQDTAAIQSQRLDAQIVNLKDNATLAFSANRDLADGIGRLADAVSEVDAKQLANDLAQVAAVMADLAARAIPAIVKGINEVVLGFRVFNSMAAFDFNIGETQKWLQYSDALGKATAAMKTLRGIDVFNPKGETVISAENFERAKAAAADLADAIKSGVADPTFTKALSSANELITLLTPNFEGAGHAGEEFGDDVAEASDKATSAVKSLREQLLGAQNAAALTGLQDQAAKLPFGDIAGLSSLSDAIAANIREGIISGLQDSIDAGGPEARAYAEELAKLKADEEVAALNTTVKDAWKDQITELVGFWQNVFENAITGEKFNLEDMFKQLAVGFAAELAAETSAAMFGVDFFKGISSPQQAGMSLAQIFLGGSDLSSIVGASGGGSGGILQSVVGGAAGAGVIGSASIGGIAEGFSAGLTGTAIAPTSAAAGTAMSVGSTVAAVAPYAAAAVGAYMLADHFGAFGGETSKEELARRGFSEWMTAQFDKLATAAFFDGKGKLQMGSAPGFQFDVSDKDVKRAQGYFAGLDSEAQGTFSALGTALKRLAGLTEQESANIAAALSEDLVGNIDNARLLVYQLGLSFEDLKGAIFEAAKAGEIRWSEYNVQIAGLADAFEPGLKAVGAYGDAFQNLIDSGGRGMAALKAVQDTAVEGMEAGLTTVDELGVKLKEQGFDPEWVDSYVGAIKAKGITTLQELADADQETMGQIVGNMESASESLGKSWQKMGEDIDSLSKKLDELNNKRADAYVTIHYSEEDKPEGTESIIPGTTPPVEPEVKSAMGNVFDSPTVSLLGEAGPEAILPLKRHNGRLGVVSTGGGGFGAVNISVDARGAQRGVSSEIVAAISAMGQAAVKRAVFEVVDGQQRGRF